MLDRSICGTCKSRAQRARDEVAYVFYHRKSRAAQRGIAWNLTREQFAWFCRQTRYLERRGTKSKDYSIDRIDPDRGYEIGNIRVVTNRTNIRREAQRRRLAAGNCPF